MIQKKLNRKKPYYLYITINRHWKMILIIGLITFAGLYSIVQKTEKYSYETSGKIRISPTNVSTIQGNESSIEYYYNEYIGTQLEKIKSKEVTERAAEIFEEKTGIDKNTAYNFISKIVDIDQEKGTHLINLTVKTNKPDNIANGVNALIDAYMETTKLENENKDNERLLYLEKEKARLQDEISKKMNELNKIAEDTGTGQFDSNDIPYKFQLQNLESQYTIAYSNRLQKEKIYTEIKEKIKKINEISIDGAVEENVKNDAYTSQRKIWLLNQIDTLQSEMEGLSASNQNRKNVESKIEAIFTEIKTLDAEARKKAQIIVKNNKELQATKDIMDAYREYQAASVQEKELKKTLDDTRSKYSNISKELMKGSESNKDMEKLKSLLDTINNRISYLTAEAKAPGRASVFSRAFQPNKPSGNDRVKRLLLAGIVSFGWIFMLCLVYDLRDKRIKRVGDIVTALGITPSWPLSNYKGEFKTVSLRDEENVVNKALRSFTNKLNKEREKHGSKVAVITGVDDKSGVTEIIMNAAHIMTEHCDKVLVIELNMQEKSLTEKYNKIEDKMPGIKGVLEGTAIEKCVYRDKEREFDFLPLDGVTSLKNKEIFSILEKAREKYDFIFIDSAPILKADITEYIVMQSEIGVLVVHGNRTKYPQMVHAVEIMQRLELPVFSLVLNWGRIKN